MVGLDKKYAALKDIIGAYGSLLVAYSGGVDSTLLLKVASDLLGKKALAVTARSPVYPSGELKLAREMVKLLGVRHRVIDSDALSYERFTRNPPDRCYWCKKMLLSRLKKLAKVEGLRFVAVASHMDDLDDYRPGDRAAREMGVVSPLRETGFNKDDIRRLSKRLGLPHWRREAMACLASRFPYGRRISRGKLEMVAKGEAYLRRRGFRNVRVRSEGEAARIEVDQKQIGRLLRRSFRLQIARAMKRYGFTHVSVDIEGYRMGSLNEALKKNDR